MPKDQDDQRTEKKRQEILERLNSYDGDGLSEEERSRLNRAERKREHEREMELERSKRHSGF